MVEDYDELEPSQLHRAHPWRCWARNPWCGSPGRGADSFWPGVLEEEMTRFNFLVCLALFSSLKFFFLDMYVVVIGLKLLICSSLKLWTHWHSYHNLSICYIFISMFSVWVSTLYTISSFNSLYTNLKDLSCSLLMVMLAFISTT